MRFIPHSIKTLRLFSLKTAWTLLAIILLTAPLTYVRVNSGAGFMGDTGQMYMVLENIHDGRGPFNPILPSEVEYFFGKSLPATDSSKLCGMALETPHFEAASYNHFKFHLYAIYYPASLLLYLFDAPYVVNGLNIFSFLFFLFLAYKISQKSETPTFISIFTVIAISLHPAWSWSIMGQPYADRMFLPFGLLLCHYAEERKKPIYALLAILALSALIVEKVPVYAGGFLIAYAILFYKDFPNKRDVLGRLLAGISALIYFYLVVNHSLVNEYYASNVPHTLTGLIGLIKNIFSDERQLNGVKSLLLVNAPLLLPALIFKPRLFLIAFVLLLPNIIGTIGGAEKTGFLTHYHTLYFPFVVYAFIKGIAEFYRRISRVRAIGIFTSYMILIASFYLFLGFDGTQKIKLTNSPSTNFYATNFYSISKNLSAYRNLSTLVESNIPSNAKISTIEAGWPYLYKFQNLSMYPFNIEQSNFLFVGYRKDAGQFYYSGFEGYLGPQQNRIVNDCLNIKIRKAGYDIDSPIILSPSLAILKRK